MDNEEFNAMIALLRQAETNGRYCSIQYEYKTYRLRGNGQFDAPCGTHPNIDAFIAARTRRALDAEAAAAAANILTAWQPATNITLTLPGKASVHVDADGTITLFPSSGMVEKYPSIDAFNNAYKPRQSVN